MTSLPVLSLGQVINIGGQMFTLTSAPTAGQFNNLNASSNLGNSGQQHSSVSGLEGTESCIRMKLVWIRTIFTFMLLCCIYN